MKKVKAQKWKLEAAVLLSDIVYGVQPHVNDQALTDLKKQCGCTISGDICFFCTKSGQKYIIVICEKGPIRVLFCAFAGSHLDGDWTETNLHVLHKIDPNVGASGHAGFLKRALEIPLEGIERIARNAKAKRIVFCGHSLGGVVSHVCRVLWLNGRLNSDDGFGKDKILSVAVGAPFFGGQAMLQHLECHGWTDGFITLVNGNDPIPRIMTLVASLSGASLNDVFAALVDSCVALVTKSQPVKGLSKTVAAAILQQHQDTYLKSYCPIGDYVFFQLDGSVEVHDCAKKLAKLLGPAQFLQDERSFGESCFDKNSVVQHGVQAYESIIKAKGKQVKEVCAAEIAEMASTFMATTFDDKPIAISAASLVPTVHEISFETFESHERQVCRILKICGHDLDFVGSNSVEIDVEKVDRVWSSKVVLKNKGGISRRSSNDLALEQELGAKFFQTKPSDDSSIFAKLSRFVFRNEGSVGKAQPCKDVELLFRSDLVVNGGGAAIAKATLPRQNCHASRDIPEDFLTFYGGQFFLDAQQHCFIVKKLFGYNGLEKKLQKLQELVEEFKCVSDRARFLEMDSSWQELECVGQDMDKFSRLRDMLYDWIVPPSGLTVRTNKQIAIARGVVVAATALGVGIVSVGGLGIIGPLLGLQGSATGGYGTCGLLTMSGVLAAKFLRTRLRTRYYVMLEDILKVYTGTIPRHVSEMELEASLIRAAADFETNKANNTLTRGKFDLFDEYDHDSQQKFERRVELITVIHEIKKERQKGSVVAICGPRDSGKTTLVSQLLRKPDLALKAGLKGGDEETRRVSPYSFEGIPGYVILDTPGLTGPEKMIRAKFDKAALNLSSTFVFIRRYDGLPTEVDVEVVSRILESSARTQQAQILICLNKCLQDLTEDAVGASEDMTAEGEKTRWLERFKELGSNGNAWFSWFAQCSIEVAFVELKGDAALEDELCDDERTQGVWTAHSIGKWISSKVAPEADDWKRFDDHMGSFSYSQWRDGVRRSREEARKQEEQTDACQRELRDL